MNISIIVPVYNEEKRILNSLEKLQAFLHSSTFDIELIFVDDGSTDGTYDLIKKYEKENIRIIRVWPNRGKGNAIKAGVLESKKDFILFMDADLATPISEISNVVSHINNYDIVIGSRNNSDMVKRHWVRLFLSQAYKIIKSLIISLSLNDTQCGFKLFKRRTALELFNRMKIERWSFDIEILFIAKKLGFSILEHPVNWEEKGGSKVRIIKDSLQMLKDLFKIRYYDWLGAYDYDAFTKKEKLHESTKEI